MYLIIVNLYAFVNFLTTFLSLSPFIFPYDENNLK